MSASRTNPTTVMLWIKDAALDVAVTLLIVLATTLHLAWAEWLLIGYTPLMLLMKVLILFSGSVLNMVKPPAAQAPPWFFHALYAINLAALIAAQWWWLAGGWALIWTLSVFSERRVRPTVRAAA